MPQKAKMTPEYKKNDASALFFKRTDENVGLHQNALESVGPPASAFSGWGGRSVFIFCILEVLALDNPRTAVYNKDKERRYPCKRLAPHQSSITKVMTVTELGNCGRSFLFVLFPFAAIRIILFPVVHQMYNTYEKCQQCDDRLEKQ